MTHLLEALLKRHVKPLVRAFADLYEIILATRNYKAALLVCAALVTAAEEHRRISQVHFTVYSYKMPVRQPAWIDLSRIRFINRIYRQDVKN